MAPETMHGQAMALGDAAARAPRRWPAARWPAPGRSATSRCAASAARPPAGAWPPRCWPTSCRCRSRCRSASTLPGWVGPETLVVVTSYSGETAEALDWFVEAGERRATRVALGSGGTLAALAETDDVPVVAVEGGYQPRGALGLLLAPLLVLLGEAGAAPDPTDLIARGADARRRRRGARRRGARPSRSASPATSPCSTAPACGPRSRCGSRTRSTRTPRWRRSPAPCPRSRTTRSSAGCRRRAPRSGTPRCSCATRRVAGGRARSPTRWPGSSTGDGGPVETWAADGPDERRARLRPAAVRRSGLVPPRRRRGGRPDGHRPPHRTQGGNGRWPLTPGSLSGWCVAPRWRVQAAYRVDSGPFASLQALPSARCASRFPHLAQATSLRCGAGTSTWRAPAGHHTSHPESNPG